jgi:hypothetical protein
MQLWSNWEAVFSTRSLRQLRDATIEELLERYFLCGPCRDVINRQSVELVQLSWVKWEDCCGSVLVSCCCKKLVAEAGDSSVAQRKGNVRRWKPQVSQIHCYHSDFLSLTALIYIVVSWILKPWRLAGGNQLCRITFCPALEGRRNNVSDYTALQHRRLQSKRSPPWILQASHYSAMS